MKAALQGMFETFSLPEKNHQVAVWMPCFNAEKWVSQAVESVLTQEGVDAVIILFDDCSTDSTASILRNLSEQYSNKIYISRPLVNTFKSGKKSLRMALLEMVQADFIAVLEADDFWNSSEKLRTSIEAIHKSGASACGHTVHVLGDNVRAAKYRGVIEAVSAQNSKIKFFRSQVFSPWRVATCSLVIRTEAFPFFLQNQIAKTLVGDLVIKLGILKSGPIEFIESPLATYRIHIESSWSSRSLVKRSISTGKTLLSLRKQLGVKRVAATIWYGAAWAMLSVYVSILFHFKARSKLYFE